MQTSQGFVRPVSCVAVIAILVLAGCRTYGGHGTVEANNAHVRAASARLSAAATQAANDFQRLSSAGRFDPNTLAAFGDVVAEQAADAEAVAAGLEASGALNYRDASRLLGYVITLEREYSGKYQNLLRAMAGATATPDPDRASRYNVVPAAWYRATGHDFTVDDVLQTSP